jgi:hypothetical protein
MRDKANWPLNQSRRRSIWCMELLLCRDGVRPVCHLVVDLVVGCRLSVVTWLSVTWLSVTWLSVTWLSVTWLSSPGCRHLVVCHLVVVTWLSVTWLSVCKLVAVIWPLQ